MSWKALVPRVVKLRMPADINVGVARPEDAVQWWANDHYVGFKSMKALRWAGVNWARWSYQKFPDAYGFTFPTACPPLWRCNPPSESPGHSSAVSARSPR